MDHNLVNTTIITTKTTNTTTHRNFAATYILFGYFGSIGLIFIIFG